MNRKRAFLEVVVPVSLIALMAAAIEIYMLLIKQPALFVEVLSRVIFVILIAAPLLAGEEWFDFWDKVVDPRHNPQAQFTFTAHFMFAMFAALLFLLIWPALVIASETGALAVSGFRFLTPHPFVDSITFPYPLWAMEWGWWAFGTFLVGYVMEGVVKWAIAKRKAGRHEPGQ